MIKKPIYEWVKELDYDTRSKAEIAMFRFPFADINTLVTSLKSAILRGFVWGCTPEGIDYWNRVYLGQPSKTLF